MQPLRLNQKFLTLVSLCAPPDDASGAEVFFYGVVGLYVFVTLCSDFISSSLFLIQWKTHVLEEVLGSVLQTAAVSGNICGMVSLFVLSKRFKGVFSLYQQIYDSSNWISMSMRILENFPRFDFLSVLYIRWTWQIGNIGQNWSTLCQDHTNFGHQICHRLSCYISHTSNTQRDRMLLHRRRNPHRMLVYTLQTHVTLPIRGSKLFSVWKAKIVNIFIISSLPWNDEEFIGWFYGLLCSFWMSGTYFFMNCIFLSFFLSVGFNFDAFQRQFDVILSEISEQNSFERNFNQHAKEVMQHAVEFHCLVKK